MKGRQIVLTGTLLLLVSGYFGFHVINEYIDRESGNIVERTLSDNTIQQLQLLTEIQSLIDSGNIERANDKLSEATETIIYILENNCALQKCKKVLRRHKGE